MYISSTIHSFYYTQIVLKWRNLNEKNSIEHRHIHGDDDDSYYCDDDDDDDDDHNRRVMSYLMNIQLLLISITVNSW